MSGAANTRDQCFPPNGKQKAQLDMLANEDPRLKPDARRIFKVLLDHHNPKVGLVYPAQSTIAQAIGRSIRWVSEMIRLLQDCGYIICRRGKGPNGTTLHLFRLELLERMKHPRGMRFADLKAGGLQSHVPELQCITDRNPSSDKLSNEPIRRRTEKMFIPVRSAKHKLGKPSVLSRKQSIQEKLAKMLGRDGSGWAILMSMEAQQLELLTDRVLIGHITLEDATDLILAAHEKAQSEAGDP